MELFALSEYVRGAGQVVYRYLDRRVEDYAPSLKLFPRVQRQVRTARMTQASGVTRIDPVRRRVRSEIDAREVIAGRLDAVRRSLDQVAKQRGPALVAQWETAVATGAAGEQVVRGNQALTWETLMDAIEQVPLEFDENDQPTFRFVMGTAAGKRLRELPPMSSKQRARWKALIDRKREEFRARRRNRRLP